MKQIHNTIKVYIYNYKSARKNDFLICNGCNPIRFGFGKSSPYVLYESTDRLFELLNQWDEKQQNNIDEHLREY